NFLQISAGNKDHVVGVNKYHKAFIYNSKNNKWNQIETDTGIRHIATNKDGEIWLITITGDIYRYKKTKGNTKSDKYRLEKNLKGHHYTISSIVFHPDPKSKLLASSDLTGLMAMHTKAGYIKIWNIETGQCIKTLKDRNIHKRKREIIYLGVRSISFNPEIKSKMLASGSDDKTIKIWDIETGQCIKILMGHTEFIRAVKFHPNPKLKILASGSNDKTIKIWNINTWQCTKTLIGHKKDVSSIAFHSNNPKIIASGSFDKTIKIWNIETEQCIKTLIGHKDIVRSIAFHPNNPKILVSGSNDKTIKIWDIETGQCIKTLKEKNPDITTSMITFHPDPKSNILASGSVYRRYIKIWNIKTGKCIQTLKTNGFVYSLAFHPKYDILASGPAYDSNINIWTKSSLPSILNPTFIPKSPQGFE
ncbi:WD40 repeat domain-containing protein, partial [Candidatus Babeliales bacterium]|nr:WD40 repeat domain-containing protein [Candidatus Babeliales bacterium]